MAFCALAAWGVAKFGLPFPALNTGGGNENIKTAVLIEGNGIVQIGTIEHEGGLWLVPLWIATQDGERQTPTRLIRLDVLPYKKVDNHAFADFQLLDPMPKGVLAGTASSKVMQSYVVKIDPAIQRPTGMTAH